MGVLGSGHPRGRLSPTLTVCPPPPIAPRPDTTPCSTFSQELGLGDFLYLGKGMNGYHEVPPNLLADVFEALVAAIFLDGGWDAAKEFVLDFIIPEIDEVARD